MKKFNLFAICVMACLFAGCEPKVTEQRPTVLTLDVTDVTTTSAIVNCNVVSDGGASVTDRGVAYDIYPNPKASGTRCKAGTGTGKYSCTLTNLEDNKKYYVRAYAKNEVGIEYGKQITFITVKELFPPKVSTDEITDILATSATVTGTIVSDGGIDITECGIVYSTSEEPTISNDKVTVEEKTEVFRCELIGLQEQTTYYVRSYAVNEKGVAYGEEKSFTTHEVTIPDVKTSSIDNVTYTSASVNVDIIHDGYATITECGVCYSTSQNPTIVNFKKVSKNNVVGAFDCNISNLTPATTYYVRAYATNSKGTAYGEQIEFTTKAHIYVDLGLSVKWATYNVGAEKPEQSGDYFSWAGTNVRKEYSIYYDCPYIAFGGYMAFYFKYCTQPPMGSPDNKTTLEPQDDAAHVNWGGNWRMPTKEEWNELKNNCTWTSVTQNGKKGYTITSTSNGNSIFLPAVGYMTDEDLEHADKGYYWSSTLRSYSSSNNGTDDYAYILYFSPSAGEIKMNTLERYRGLPVRAVCP